MAKRSSRSEAHDAAGTAEAPPAPKARRARAGSRSADQTPSQAPPAQAADTFDVRPGADEYRSSDASSTRSRSDSMASEPSEEDIRLRAYQRYLERGGSHGMDYDDWLEAERDLKKR
jgi:DUF2934 family protein